MVDALYRRLLLPPVKLLTRRDAARAHEWALTMLQILQKQPKIMGILDRRNQLEDACLEQTLLEGLTFPNPIGIAAGWDKNAAIYPALEVLTKPGFIEVGTVTLRAQIGNPRPRITRVGGDSLINAMGFPNQGIEKVMKSLMSMPSPRVPLGLNIGKLKETSGSQVSAEHAELIRMLKLDHYQRKIPNFYVVNVSSPNTPGLRSLQAIEPLTDLLTAVTTELDAQSDDQLRLRQRLLVKLSPDLSEAEVEAIIDLVLSFDIGGVILTNTTVERPIKSTYSHLPGGLSGPALYARSFHLVRFAAGLLPRSKVLVACGGINTVDRAYEMLRYADLLEIYTGLIFEGPGLLRRLNRGIAERMQREGISSLAELRYDQRIG